MGDVKITFTGDGAKLAKELAKLQEHEAKLGQAGEDAGRKSKKGAELASQGLARMGTSLAGIGAVFASVGAAGTKIFNQWKAELNEIVDKAKQFQDTFVDLQAMGNNYQFSQQMRSELRNLAVGYGVENITELNRGMYTLQSMTGHLTGEAGGQKRWQMFGELLQQRTLTSMPLEQLVAPMSKMSAMYQDLTPNELQNIIQFTIEKAAVQNPAELPGYLPTALAGGQVGKVDARYAAGLFSAMTGKTGTTAQAAQAVKMMMTKVMTTNAPEDVMAEALAPGGLSKSELFGQAGITEAMNAEQRLSQLQGLYAKGKLGAPEMLKIFGERGMVYAEPFFQDYQGIMGMVGEFRGETGADKDIVGSKLSNLLQTDPVFRERQMLKMQTARDEVAKLLREEEALRHEGQKRRLTGSLREQGASGFTIWGREMEYEYKRWMGYSPEGAVEGSARGLFSGDTPEAGKSAYEPVDRLIQSLDKNTAATEANSQVSGQSVTRPVSRKGQ